MAESWLADAGAGPSSWPARQFTRPGAAGELDGEPIHVERRYCSRCGHEATGRGVRASQAACHAAYLLVVHRCRWGDVIRWRFRQWAARR